MLLVEVRKLFLFLAFASLILSYQTIKAESAEILPEVKYFVDPSRQLTIEQVGEQESLFLSWGKDIPTGLQGNPGNIWVRISANLQKEDLIYELKSTFLFDFQGYIKKTDGSFEKTGIAKSAFGKQVTFAIPKREPTELFLLIEQEYGFHLLKNLFYKKNEHERLNLRRILVFAGVMGAFVIALILIILAGTKDKIQLMLLLQMFGSLIGLCLEHKIYIYFDLVFETGNYFKLLSLNILFSTSVYLLIIRDETGLFVNKIYTKFIFTMLFILLAFFILHLIFPSQILWQCLLGMLLFMTIIFLSSLIYVWNSKPHLRFITVILLMVYIPLVLSLLVIPGVLSMDFWIWDPNFRLAVPIFMTHLLYLRREQRLKVLTQELDQKNIQLLQVDKYKDLFLARTSHELRTPLNAIIGFGENLIQSGKELNRLQEEKLNWIVHSASRMSRMISDLSDFTRIRESELEINTESQSLRKILDLVKPVLEMDFQQKGIYWQDDVSNSLPPIQVDSQRMQQVFINLIGNSVKYTNQGGVRLSANLNDDFLEINLSDTGVGIPESEIKQVMEDFKRGSNTYTMPGRGLGLNLSRYLIEKQKGNLEVFSQENHGTRIRIMLPLAKKIEPYQEDEDKGVDDGTSEKEKFEISEKSEESGQSISLKGDSYGRVMVIDDEPLNLRLIESNLEGLKYDLHFYQSGHQALEALNENDPDLILLDLMMPGVDGYEVIKAIRSNYTLNQIPIIVITANQQEHLSRKSIQLGANDYLIKPYSAEELRVRVNSQLRISKQKKTEEELEISIEKENRERRERVRASRILDFVNIPLAMLDAEWGILQVNREFERLLGYSQIQLQGQRLNEILRLEALKLEPLSSAVQISHASGEMIPARIRLSKVELQDRDEYVFIIIPSESSDSEESSILMNSELKQNASGLSENLDQEDQLRMKICGLLNLSLKYYEYATGQNASSLALESGIWHATLNGTTYRAYMLERYLKPERIPKKYKWGIVMQTVDWVLENCQEHQELKKKMIQQKNEIEEVLL
jgi:PAS domain S-box-containing protein